MEQGAKPLSGIPRMSRLPISHGSRRDSESTLRQSIIPPVVRGTGNAIRERQQRGPASSADSGNSTSLSRGNKISIHEPSVADEQGTPGRSLSSDRKVCGTSRDALLLKPSSPLCQPPQQVRTTISDPADFPSETPKARRKPRPSLSDRTIETLLQIPPSPSSNRRTSSFFNAEATSPMRPPLRPASAMSASRSRPTSPIKQPPVPPIPISFAVKPTLRTTTNTTNTRSMTQTTRPTIRPPVKKTTIPANNPTTSALKPKKHPEVSKPTSSIRQVKVPPEKQSNPSSLSRNPVTRRKPPAVKTKHAAIASGTLSAVSTPTTASLSSYGSRRSSAQSLQSCSTEVEGLVEAQTKDFSKSSASLRCAITKAKQEAASRKVLLGRVRGSAATSLGRGLSHGLNDDPFIVEEADRLLKNRIKGALLSGNLNVAAMQLMSIPAGIKQMYDVHEHPSIPWAECVDLTKFIIADNKLERLDEDIFPDATDAELEFAEFGEYNGQLRGLEVLDVHNNLLNDLPLGMRRLQKLRSLNISGNRLDERALDLVCQIGNSLTDLRMAENKLSGILPNCIKNLPNLQVLDLHGNNLSALPDALQELVHLRILNLAQNRLSSIPAGILVNLSLVDLILSGNQLSGVLLPSEIQSLGKSLKLLDVSHNALEAISPALLPSVQTLNLTGNRFKSLPDVSSWHELLTIAAGGNLLCELPPGLTTLCKLRNADFSNNNIAKLHDGIASMENLNTINLAGNPLRERKYLTMSAQDLKADLQKRGLVVDGTQEVDAVPTISITSSNGILDWSARSLSESKIQIADLKDPIYDLRLHHNALGTIPVSFIAHPAVSETLKLLDLAHNAFQTSYLSTNITLPRLKDLSLASCQLKSLDDLTSNITAPELITLNISTNRLKGTLPQLRAHFPALTALFVADNKFNDLKVAAVQGLITLDIRNNEIEHLEPRLGLLGGSAGLRALEVSGNRLRVPRWDVLEKGTEAVLRYLRGRVPLDELGDDAAGMVQKM